MPVVLQNQQRVVALDRVWLRRTAEAVLSAARADDAELSLVLVSDRRMRALNRRYRKKDQPTDVLAFPLLEPSGPSSKRRSPAPAASVAAKSRLSRVPIILGDVVISVPMAKRQAAELGHGLREELRRLLVHAVLHLMGYDHERGPRDAALMARKEQAILKALGGRVRVGVQE